MAQAISPVVITTTISEVPPLLFNKHWTAHSTVITEKCYCNDCNATLYVGMKALVLEKDGRPKYTFCDVTCQRRAAFAAKALKDAEWQRLRS